MVDPFGKAATGGSYFNKYLMCEDGCINVCVFSGGWGGLVIYMCVAISVCISMKSHLKGVLNEGEDHFLTPSPKWEKSFIFFIFFSASDTVLSSSGLFFHPSRNLSQ